MWLVGMMGTGKTAAGRIAANRLDVEFADTDQLVEAAAGRSIAELWEVEGEAGFRERERVVVADLGGFEGLIATGGGAVLDPANRAVMRQGTVVWLRASPPVLAKRVGLAPNRPLLSGVATPADSLARLLEERDGLYDTVANHVIDTDELDIESIARRIEDLWSE